MKRKYGITALAGGVVLTIALAIVMVRGDGASALKPCLLAKEEKASFVDAVTVQDASGKSVTLGGAREKSLLLNFWASWCAPCVHELPALQQLMTHIEGVDFFAISQDDERQDAFLKARALENLPVIYDAYFRLARHFSVSRLPVTMLLNAEGRLVWRYDGACDWENAAVDAFYES